MRETYLDQGYTIVRGVLDSSEVARVAQAFRELARGTVPSDVLPTLSDAVSDQDAAADLLAIHQPHLVSDVVRELIAHPKIAEIASELVGAHLPWWDGAVKCVQSQAFFKPPGFEGMAWHQDEAYIPTRDRSLCAVWIAIDPTDEDNGTLRVIPSSHRTGYLWPQSAHDTPDEYDFAPTATGFEGEEVVIKLEPGDALFLHGYLLHRSTKNRSDRTRRVLSYHFMNAWSLLPWVHTPQTGMIATTDVRTVIPVSGTDPYAWKGYLEGGPVSLRTCPSNASTVYDRAERLNPPSDPQHDP